jgi:hypothetical protein
MPSSWQIDPESVKNLRKYFTQSQVREIVGYVYFITFTNLGGNTVDAVLERVRGPGRPITVVEGISGVVLAPILLLLVVLVKAGKLIGTDRRRAKRAISIEESVMVKLRRSTTAGEFEAPPEKW